MTYQEMTARLGKLRAARYAGTREVQFSDGRRVRYGTDAEFAAAISALEKQIADAEAAASGRRRSRVLRPYAVRDL
jgi:hypothetical protein